MTGLPTNSGPHGATVLVIEDEPDILASVLAALESEGFEVIGAENGRIGVALAFAERPDLILCDVSMPELDGYGVLRALQQFPETVNTPFIFLSARSERADVRAGMNLGADDYLVKPFSVSELFDAIHARLRTRSVRTPSREERSVVPQALAPTPDAGLLRPTVMPREVVGERFEVESRAGSGGMATVFRARDLREDRAVALKVLHSQGEKVRERFNREAEVLAELSHPHIVRYVAHGVTSADAPYLAMEWLEGEDLSARFARGGRLTVGESARLIARAARALGHAHARGVLHRDVKPSNLFLVDGDVDKVKLLDFGIARKVAAAAGTTRTGTTLGTPGYMAPEQASGLREVDARSDVFSLGCVLYECVVGEAPFLGENVMVILSKILFDDAPRLSARQPAVLPALDDLVARMLSRDPAGRPADGAAVADELDALREPLERVTAEELPAVRVEPEGGRG